MPHIQVYRLFAATLATLTVHHRHLEVHQYRVEGFILGTLHILIDAVYNEDYVQNH